MKFMGLLVLGILIGCAAAGGYAYPLLQNERQKVTAAEASRDALGKTVKEQEEQLKGALAARSSLETDAQKSRAQLGQLQSALKETKDQLGQIQASHKEPKKELARAPAADPPNTVLPQAQLPNTAPQAQLPNTAPQAQLPNTAPQTQLPNTAPELGTTSEEEIRTKTAQWNTECIGDWDRQTHMTKKEWASTCLRVVDDRVKWLRNRGTGSDLYAPLTGNRYLRNPVGTNH